MDTRGKEGSFKPLIFVMLISLAIAGLWNSFPVIKNTVHFILDPSAGILLDWNLTIGMFIIVFILALITTLAQKYATDQETLREMKKEQKKLSEEMKEFKNNPEKVMEIQKKQMEFMSPMMKLSMRPIMFTGIPFLLFFRWFMDYFGGLGECGFYCNHYWIFTGWLLAYLFGSIIFSSILRKIFNVV